MKLLPLLLIGCAWAAPAENAAEPKTAAVPSKDGAASDLNPDASSYYDRYSDYGSRSFPSAYGGGYNAGAGGAGYGAGGYGGTGGAGGYGAGGYGAGGYGGVMGYGDDRYSLGSSDGYDRGNTGSYGGVAGGYNSYDRGYGASSGGYGGYGGYGGNGGLNTYYGYNNPSYQGYGLTGYGYYNRRPGYGNIYSSGITPSLVTGYRGYSRK